MPMTRSKAMAFAGQACYGVDARQRARQSPICSMRTASPIACRPAQTTQHNHQQQPVIVRTAIPRSLLCTNSTQSH
eukprot:8666107-Pyramimonas_sp.AAC.1